MQADVVSLEKCLLPRLLRWREYREYAIRLVLALCAGLSILTTVAISTLLIKEAYGFFRIVSVGEFLFGTRWTPLFQPSSFGVLPLVCGTMLIVGGASIVALPVGMGCALYLSEFAVPRTRAIMKPVLELIAGVPTIVYGYFALTFVTPLLKNILPEIQVFNALSAAIVVGFMIMPMIASLCDDAFNAVSDRLRQAGYALGSTTHEVAIHVVVPAALPGVMGAVMLALSRAIGETMAVTLAAGATPRMTLNPLESVQTMTAFIAQVSMGDTPTGSLAYQTLFAVGLLLFVITFSINAASHLIFNKFRQSNDG